MIAPDTVKTREDIIDNIIELYSNEGTEDHNEFKRILKMGSRFVAWKNGEDYKFAPSRYVGYLNNTIRDYSNNRQPFSGVRIHAQSTGMAIRNILGKEKEDDVLKEILLEHCLNKGIVLANKVKHTFWLLEEEVDEELIEEKQVKVINDLDITETEKEALIKSRVGQGKFRRDLISFWNCCSVTGSQMINLLRASHIKPWRKSSNEDRLNPYNGLLLMPNLDSLFDKGYITFTDNGEIMISDLLSDLDIAQFGLRYDMRVRLEAGHLPYIKHHRDIEFKRS